MHPLFKLACPFSLPVLACLHKVPASTLLLLLQLGEKNTADKMIK
jgi:hypothetical protein